MIHLTRVSPKRWLYYGTEDEVTNDFLVQKFWFIEDSPPFRVGNGWRLRGVRDVAFHLGIAVRSAATTAAEALGGSELETDPESIGRWSTDVQESEEAEASRPGQDVPAAPETP